VDVISVHHESVSSLALACYWACYWACYFHWTMALEDHMNIVRDPRLPNVRPRQVTGSSTTPLVLWGADETIHSTHSRRGF
jgi:hypothetical protein